MGTFTAADVKRLREMTGIGMMKCKEALNESGGDMDMAIDWLRRKGEADAVKRACHRADEGVVYADVINGIAVIVDIRCETDFVAQSDRFMEFVHGVANTISIERPYDLKDLFTCHYANSTENITVQEYLNRVIQVVGENIKIQRFAFKDRYRYVAYTHMNGRVAVLMELDTNATYDIVSQVGKNLAMQVAALNPRFLNKSKVPASEIEKEKGIMLSQLDLDPRMASKPVNVKEKIIAGKFNKYYSENCLMQQEFVNKDLFTGTVEGYIREMEKRCGVPIRVISMTRYERGEAFD